VLLDVASQITVYRPVPIVTVLLHYVTVFCKSQFSVADKNTAYLSANVISCLAIYCFVQVEQSAAASQLIPSAVQNFERYHLGVQGQVSCTCSTTGNCCCRYDIVMIFMALQCVLNIYLCYAFFPSNGFILCPENGKNMFFRNVDS